MFLSYARGDDVDPFDPATVTLQHRHDRVRRQLVRDGDVAGECR
jgi:hypothetical protein